MPALRDHQVRAISYCLKNPYAIIGLDPGLGKSRVAIEVREKLKANCLIICPGYLVPNWQKEISRWAPAGTLVTAIRTGKQIYDIFDSDYVVVSYDLVQKAPHFFEWAKMVVLDEPHSNIKSMKAKRTTFIHKHVFENNTKRLYMLTGTPIKNRVQEFYSLLALTFYNPSAPDVAFLEKFPSEIDFADHFSHRREYVIEIRNRFVTILKWEGIKNVDELRGYLKHRYIRIRLEDVLDLPPVSYKSVLISEAPEPELLKAFNNYFANEDNTSVGSREKAQAALNKTPFTIKYAKDLIEEVGCLLIYSDHVEASEAIAKEFGVKAINGKMSASKRSEMADAFQRGESNILVATVGSLKEGKDLFRANHLVFNDYPWVPGDMKQVIHRIQRLGQKNPCTIHRILGSPQDEYILETLEEKVKVISKIC